MNQCSKCCRLDLPLKTTPGQDRYQNQWHSSIIENNIMTCVCCTRGSEISLCKPGAHTKGNEGALDIGMRGHWRGCVVLRVKPGPEGLQGAVRTAPAAVVHFVLEASGSCLPLQIAFIVLALLRVSCNYCSSEGTDAITEWLPPQTTLA